MSEDIQEMTWDYLRRSYFPQFMAGIMRLEWPERFLILQELYNSDESDPPWEIRSNDPMIDMMTWIGEKGADAYNKGVFAATLLEFRPLAEQGHTAAQRQVELLRK